MQLYLDLLYDSVLELHGSSFCVSGSQAEGGAQEATDGEEEQAQEMEQPPEELVKQEMLVQYLQDAYNFSAKITEALSLVSRLMYESSVSGRCNLLLVYLFLIMLVLYNVVF